MRRNGIVPWLVGILVFAAVCIGVETTLLVNAVQTKTAESDANASAAAEGGDLADQVIAACGRDDAIGQSVRDAGLCKSAEDTKDTVVDILDDATPTPAPTNRAAGPSNGQVLAAVTLLLPPAVRDLIAARIGSDLADYCATRNQCVGPAAPPAKDGKNGTDGRPGETPSTELLLSLIQPLIPPPEPGTDGIGVLAITCTSPTPFPVSFDFALSNGTTQTVTCPTVLDPETPSDPETPAAP